MKIVLAYSGGLDTAVALHWLKQRYDAEVIAFCANIGQPDSMAEVEQKARTSGAADVYIEDLRHEYLTDFAFKALKANAAYEDRYLMAAPLGRPLIAKRLVEIAHEVGASAVAHGSTGKGNDQVRFYTTAVAHNPEIQVIAPCIEWELTSREDEIEYAQRHGIPISATPKAPYSVDGSIWGTSTECGILDDFTKVPPDDVYRWTQSPEAAPDTSGIVSIRFERGVPTEIDGRLATPVELVTALNHVGGTHGIGRIDVLENSLLGIKTRAIYEAPGATILHAAHRELESVVLDRDTLHYKAQVAQKYAELVYYGLWYSPLKASLDAFVDHTQERVTGTISMKLYKGTLTALRRESPNAMYSYSLSTHDPQDRFDHHAAPGFSYVWSMPLRVQALTAAERTKRRLVSE